MPSDQDMPTSDPVLGSVVVDVGDVGSVSTFRLADGRVSLDIQLNDGTLVTLVGSHYDVVSFAYDVMAGTGSVATPEAVPA